MASRKKSKTQVKQTPGNKNDKYSLCTNSRQAGWRAPNIKYAQISEHSRIPFPLLKARSNTSYSLLPHCGEILLGKCWHSWLIVRKTFIAILFFLALGSKKSPFSVSSKTYLAQREGLLTHIQWHCLYLSLLKFEANKLN